MLRWPIAANDPSSHRGDRDEHDDLLPLRRDLGKRRDRRAHEHRDRGDLRRGGEERRHRRRRALVDVGRPHVERHGRDLEAEAREQEHEAESEPDAALPGGLRDAGEAHRAGEAVDQRGAIEQHPGRQRAEHEVFQARLGRAHASRGCSPPPRRAQGSSVRARDRARSGRRPRSASACRWSRAGSGSRTRTSPGARPPDSRAPARSWRPSRSASGSSARARNRRPRSCRRRSRACRRGSA